MRSRVVPGTAVTMATSSPASALSTLDLPTFGAPTSTTWTPSRRIAPWRARCSTSSSKASNPLQPSGSVRLVEEVDLFLWKIERRLDQRAQVGQFVGQRVYRARELARQRARGRTSRRLGRCIDQVGDRLGLREVDAVREKSAPRELTRFGQPQPDRTPGFEAARHQHAQHHRPAMPLEFEHVFAGVRVRRREEERDAAVDHLAVAVEECAVGCPARFERTRRRAQHSFDHRRDVRTRYAHDADASAPGRRGDGNDRILVGSHA